MKSLPTRMMRANPDLNQLKRQAKELLDAFLTGDEKAVIEVNTHYRSASPATFALHDAQLVIARAYGFESWPKLKAYVDGVTVHTLVEAVRGSDMKRARSMLKARPELANMEMAENNEHRAIHYAVFNRSPEMVRLLMQHGADARRGIYPHRDATTALTIATERGYDDVVAAILDEEQRRAAKLSGAGTTATSVPDQIIEAIADGKDDAALNLLENDPALTKSSNRNGWTPLHAAAAYRREPLIEWLLAHGAEVNRLGPGDRTPLDLAVGTPSTPDGGAGRFTPLAALLTQHGAHITPRAAVALGDVEWLRKRHAEGTLTNPIEGWGGLLTIAAMYNRPDILTLLLDFGLNVDERVRLDGIEETIESGGMPLWYCASVSKYELAELLLKRGASPNIHVYASGSAVYRAFSQQDWKMVDLLKRYGGVVDAVTVGLFRETELARQMIADWRAGRLPKEALESDNVGADLLRGAADGGDPEIVRMALELIDWPRDDDRWYWILMQPLRGTNPSTASPGTFPECLRLVLERCTPNLRHPRFARTILHDVAGFGHYMPLEDSLAFARLLLDAGAWLDIRDGVLLSTPLGWACRWGRVELVKLFLERGADPVERDAEPWARPLTWAEKKNHPEIAALLRERM